MFREPFRWSSQQYAPPEIRRSVAEARDASKPSSHLISSARTAQSAGYFKRQLRKANYYVYSLTDAFYSSIMRMPARIPRPTEKAAINIWVYGTSLSPRIEEILR